MSYDVAVWEGKAPSSDPAALDVYESLWRRYERVREPPSERLVEFVHALTSRYPDLTDVPEELVDDSPWADGPLVGSVIGGLLYMSLVPAMADDVLPFIADTARARGLVCFDPQTARLL